MKVTYDEEVQAMYIKVSKGKIEDTVKYSDLVYLDFGKNKKLIGIEILGVMKIDNIGRKKK